MLYLLLPEAPPFGPFLLVYLLALAAGVLSHVPGGVGVFEAILLAAFADKLGAAPLAAALLLYRMIYVVLPLLIACVFCWSTRPSACSRPSKPAGGNQGWQRQYWPSWFFCPAWSCCFPAPRQRSTHAWKTSASSIPHRLIDASHFRCQPDRRVVPVARPGPASALVGRLDADHGAAAGRRPALAA